MRFAVTLAAAAIFLAALVAFGVRQYGGNVSALLHVDAAYGTAHSVPPGVVLYQDGGYDGMSYYQVARDLASLSRGEAVPFETPYRFQRILLPLCAFVLALGREEWFPAAMLAINAVSILGTFAVLMVAMKKPSVHAVAGFLNPAALVGLLYMLTEPLSMFFATAFLARWLARGKRVDAAAVALLALSLFARETTVFLIGLLFLWHAWRRDAKGCAALLVPVALFAAWQGILSWLAGSYPSAVGGNMVGIPFAGPAMAVAWALGASGPELAYRLSSLALLAFVACVAGALASDAKKSLRDREPLWFLLAGLTAVMFLMHPHIWGAITSIGRVVTPLYPAYALYAASRDTKFLRLLSLFLAILSLVAAVGIAAARHPFIVS